MDNRLLLKFTSQDDKSPIYIEVNQIVAFLPDGYNIDKTVIHTTSGRDFFVLEPINKVEKDIRNGWYLGKSNY
mgnify:CR=1 FL=1